MSYDPSGRPLKSVQWRVAADSATNSSRLTGVMAAVNKLKDARSQSVLTVPPTLLKEMFEDGEVDFKITAAITNAFGMSIDAVSSFMIKNVDVTPVVKVLGPTADRVFKIKDGLKVETAVDASAVCGLGPVDYQWTGTKNDFDRTSWSAFPAAAAVRDSTLVVPGPLPNTFDGERYVVTLTAEYGDDGNENAATLEVTLVAQASDLLAAIDGPSSVAADKPIVLSAAGSYDPDGEAR